MSYEAIKHRLVEGGRIILDGGVGTELERRGADMDAEAWCGPASAENAELLQDVHEAYIAAGAEVITANTYASSRVMLRAAGMEERTEDINRIAVDAAQAARRQAGRPIALAGSLSHAVPAAQKTNPEARAAQPSAAALEDALCELALLLEDSGCDLLVLEMMYDPDRIPAVAAAARASNLPVWAGFSARRGRDGRILSYDRKRDLPFDALLPVLADFPAAAAGVMHSPADLTGEALSLLRSRYDGPLTAYPDSGHFRMPNWQFEDVIAPSDFAAYARNWAEDLDVRVLGGCCGLGPEHIEALVPLRAEG